MPPRSPQADNWLRTTSAFALVYNVAFVPYALKDGYVHFFDHVLRKRNYRVATHMHRVITLEKMLHPEIFDALIKEQLQFVKKYPHVDGLFDGLQYIIYNKTDGRPFPRNFDEDEFLENLKEHLSMKPHHANGYASAIQYDIGNGIVTPLPILVLPFLDQTAPVPMQPL